MIEKQRALSARDAAAGPGALGAGPDRSRGDRHYPSCQASHARQWLEQQRRWLLPVPYFHVVFTLPREWRALLFCNQAALYKVFFEAVASLLELARSRWQGTPGLTLVLHTGGQQLNYHPHLHGINDLERSRCGVGEVRPASTLERKAISRFTPGGRKNANVQS